MSVLIGTTQVSGRGEPRRGAAAVPHHNTTQHLALANLTSANTRCSSDDAQHVSVLAITLLMHHLHRLMHYGTNLGLNDWPNESKSLSFCFLFVVATYVCIFSGTDLSAGKKIIFYSKVLNKNQARCKGWHLDYFRITEATEDQSDYENVMNRKFPHKHARCNCDKNNFCFFFTGVPPNAIHFTLCRCSSSRKLGTYIRVSI